MCGICGVVAADGDLPTEAFSGDAGDDRGDPASRAGWGRGLDVSEGRARPSPAGDHRSRRRPPADGQRGRTRAGSSSTARSTTITSLRSRLMARGHRFRTNSDTEAIIHAYEEYGPACVDHLEGMFAFAIYDVEEPRAVHRARSARQEAAVLRRVRRRAAFRRARSRRSARARRWTTTLDLCGARRLSVARLLAGAAHRSTATSGSSSRAIGCGCARSASSPQVLGRRGVRHRSAAGGRDRRASLTSLLRDRGRRAPRERSAARRVSVRRHRLRLWPSRSWPRRRGSRVITTSVGFGEAAHNELDAAGSTARSSRHRASRRRSSRRRWTRCLDRIVGSFDEPFADASAIPTYYVSRDGAAARHRRAERRRRRRNVRRLQLPLHPARARRRWRARRAAGRARRASGGAGRRGAGRGRRALPRPLRLGTHARKPRPRSRRPPTTTICAS